MRNLVFFAWLLAGLNASAQLSGRTVTAFNHDWRFAKDTVSVSPAQWQPVTLPHTWNVSDVMDDVPGYYRGIGWYRKTLFIDSKTTGKELFLFFEGANQVTDVFVNGKKAGSHVGGYSGFYIAITGLISPGKENCILVRVDNSHNQDIPPLSADFTFYGGIYRDVWLVTANPVHFKAGNTTGNGLRISTPSVDAQSGIVRIRAKMTNQYLQSKRVRLNVRVQKPNGELAGTVSRLYTLHGNSDTMIDLPPVRILRPELWSPESPRLYNVVAEISDEKTGAVLDALYEKIGFRWFRFDASKGFFLNDKPYKLVGASRHQDYESLGNAVPDSLAVKDIVLLKEMGGNFLRVAHYPQDPSVMKACDSLGILASVEIPLVNEISETKEFFANSIEMQKEMIAQHFNHPSVIMWCYMNEVLLRPHYTNDKPKQEQYVRQIAALARQLDSVSRAEDPYRYTMIAHHGDYRRYRDAGLIDIPMVVGWNLYSGWYGARMEDFPAFLDAFHADYPHKPTLVSEYGADADPRISSTAPQRFDKSVEYTTRLHQYYLEEMLKRPFVAAAMIWNLADFNSETRTESMPHINNKGLLKWDRTPKAPYYYYKAKLAKNPFIKIISNPQAAGLSSDTAISHLKLLQVASNLSSIELEFNGHNAGAREVINGIAEWKVPFVNGRNSIKVQGTKKGRVYADTFSVDFIVQPNVFSAKPEFTSLNILLGSQRYFTDATGITWIPDKEYRAGSWGYIGGLPYKIPNNNRLPYGTDKNILGTFDDPIYQTQRTGIGMFKLDLPDGEYEITFYFAELQGGTVRELPYNLNDPDRIEPKGRRIFSVNVNGSLVIDHLDLASQYGPATAVSRSTTVNVTHGKGIEVTFTPIEGSAVLNALKVVPVTQQPKPVLSSTR